MKLNGDAAFEDDRVDTGIESGDFDIGIDGDSGSDIEVTESEG